MDVVIYQIDFRESLLSEDWVITINLQQLSEEIMSVIWFCDSFRTLGLLRTEIGEIADKLMNGSSHQSGV